MKMKNPIQQSKYIEKEFRNYIKSTFVLDEPEYLKQFYKELEGTDLYKGPFISVSLPFELGCTLNQLINLGVISSEFKKFDEIKLDRPLYYHQEKALKRINKGHNVVITTGTGSGKTESFLYPILDKIAREIQSGNTDSGIRALFLYPMNALVNDQIDRVRKILINYPSIKYGFFTGELDEKSNQYTRKNLSKINDCIIPDNELVSREEIRKSPPHLLFTNYSMLEYLLIRPNDFNVLTSNSMKYWQYIVLDEAHTYQGALGIEVAMLMRRVTGLLPKKPQFILTSATLGNEKEDIYSIISFAKSLTSASYEKEDIIFAKRIPLDDSDIEYSISPNQYHIFLEKINQFEKLLKVTSEYGDFTYCENSAELLFELLKKDRNLYDLYDILSRERVMDFTSVMEELTINGFKEEKELVDFIQLIVKSNFKDKTFFSVRYHTFIRTLDGAFITLGDNKRLKLSNHKKINDDNAFEIGICKYCNTMYIIGKVINDHLYQNNDIDIYENYGDIDEINLEFFLIKNQVENKELDYNNLIEYILCKKCGRLHMKDNLNAEKCHCGQENEINIFLVNKKNSNIKNNLSVCPCCGHSSNQSGIISGFHLGKDQATAIISQILYKAIDSNEFAKEQKQINYNLDFIILNKYNVEKEDKTKQFIAFSDSRQQASFFADFFSYNHERFLRKKLIWNELESNDHNPIKLDTMARTFENAFIDNKLFDSQLSEHSEAWITVLHELLKIDGDYSGEGLGLFLCKLNFKELKKVLDEERFNQYFSDFNIRYNDFFNYLSVVFEAFRTVPAINYEDAQLTQEEKEQNLSYRRFINYVTFKKDPRKKELDYIRSFLPIRKNTKNHIISYTMRVLEVDYETAIDFLERIFNIGKTFLFEDKTNKSIPIYQINAKKYMIHSYREFNWYRCSKCGRVTIYNVKNVCPKPGCDGIIIECNVDEVFKNNYYRNEYVNKKIEMIVIKEHTAQLSKDKAKQYQRDFKNHSINILSCSTTFEMGVDIGNLETVFLRNVPPTPANYAQRAGRAGRRDDSNAFVLTFCGTSSHDYTFFNDPTKMIAGHILPPKFTITNEKILLRHLLASSFGFFFRINEEYYKNIESLVLKGGLDKFILYLESKPNDLKEYIDNKLLDHDTYDTYSNFKWVNKVLDVNGNVNLFKTSIISRIEELVEAEKRASKEGRYLDANYYNEQIKRLKEKNVINSLSDYTVIPKYGFPVDVVNLQIYDTNGRVLDYDMSRDLSIAISEYAPDSEVIVDGKKFTSRYIVKPYSGNLTKCYYYICNACDHINIGVVPENIIACNKCNEIHEIPILDYFVIPIYGFRTDLKNKETRAKKPKKTYASEIKYIGNGISNEDRFVLNSFITVESARNDELLVLNDNPFYMCSICGYTLIDKNARSYTIKREHKKVNGQKCNSSDLHKVSLGHMFKTDVVKIAIKKQFSKNEMLSLLFAILEGVSGAFDIERKDINGIINKSSEGGFYDIILFDNVAGGAGHVKRILSKKGMIEVINLAYKKVNMKCCDENTSCYNCLRNYNNQRIHNILKRKYAKDILKLIIDDIV